MKTLSEKVEVGCPCGKRYRVPASKPGSRFRCRRCRTRLRVPGEALLAVVVDLNESPEETTPDPISEDDRLEILAELGVDAQVAEQAYLEGVRRRQERDRQRRSRQVRRCDLCARPLAASEDLDERGFCGNCRGDDHPARPGSSRSRLRLERWTSTRDEEARLSAIKIALLVLVGSPGFVHYTQAAFTTPRLWLTVLVSVGLVAFAWRAILFGSAHDSGLPAGVRQSA